MADDFSFDCPRCGKEPKRGKFLGSQIWHDECLIEDLTEKFQNGTSREEIEKTLKRIKDKGIEQNVGLKCGWPEYQPPKTQEEIEAEYKAELDAAEANQQAEEAVKAVADATDDKSKAAAEIIAAEAQQKAQDASKAADSAKIDSSKPQIAILPTNQTMSSVGNQPTIQNAGSIPIQPMQQYSMPQMPMMLSSQTEKLKPAPKDPVIRNMTISAMNVCLKNMKKDIEFGRLLFKFIKEFDWAKNDDETENISEDFEDYSEEEGQKPFLVED